MRSMKIKNISIIVILVVIIGASGFYLTNSAPEFMMDTPTYKKGSTVTVMDFITDAVVNLTDDRTNVEDLDITVLKDNIVIDDINSATIDTNNPRANEYKIIVKDKGFKSTTELLYYTVI